jgi:hypothetical protein
VYLSDQFFKVRHAEETRNRSFPCHHTWWKHIYLPSWCWLQSQVTIAETILVSSSFLAQRCPPVWWKFWPCTLRWTSNITALYGLESGWKKHIRSKFPSQWCMTVCQKARRNLNGLGLFKVDSYLISLLKWLVIFLDLVSGAKIFLGNSDKQAENRIMPLMKGFPSKHRVKEAKEAIKNSGF